MIADKHVQKEIRIETDTVPVWTYGDVENPAIFFIHGFPYPFSRFVGDLPIRYLMKDYYIVAFDMPGFGKSESVRVPVERFIEEIEKQLQIQTPYTLFGVSYGGAVSIKYAQKNPHKINGVIIAGTPFFGWFLRTGIRVLRLVPFMKRHIKEFSRNYPSLTTKNIKRVSAPILLLYSENDTLGKLKMGEKLEKLVNGKLVKITGRTHNWLLHRVDESGFLEEITAFLTSNTKQK